jgi:histidinol-phosphate aminotransferase
VVRTFSKAHGLAGLRVGYAVTSSRIADALNRVRTIFNVSHVAQVAAEAALRSEAEIEVRAASVRRGRIDLARILEEAGLSPLPSQGNFVFAEMPRQAGSVEAARLADRLLLEGVIVRRMDSFGAPDALRITVGTDEEHEVLAAALARIESPRAA